MTRIFTLMLLLAAFSNNVFSQACTPIVPPVPGPSCAEAPFLCCGEVNDLQGTLPSFVNVNGPVPLCPNSSTIANNIEWVSFAAGTTSITLEVILTNCTQTGNGIGAQVGIYDDCDFANAIFCNGGQNQGTLIIPMNNLIVGEVYHLFIDGFSGSVCDYDFNVTSGNTFAPEPQSPASISGLTALCDGAPAQTYFAGLGVNSSFNYWEITPSDVSFNDNGQSITVTDWGSAVGSTATICVEGLNDCYQNPEGLDVSCITVTVNEDQMTTAMGQFCEGDPGYIFPQNGLTYGVGTHTVVVPDPGSGLGCDIVYELDVTNLPPEDYAEYVVLCPGEPYIIEGTPYFPPINGLGIPLSVPGTNGCPRTLTLTLQAIDTSVSIQANPGLQLSCDVDQILLTANVNFDPQVTYSYEWDTNDGCILGGGGQQTALVTCVGEYTLSVTMESFDDFGTVICMSTLASITITEDVTGPNLSVTSQTASSCGTTLNGTATVSPSGATPPYTYQWDSNASNQTTSTATGLAAGTYQVTVLDATMCPSVTQVEVLGTPLVAIDASPAIIDVACFGDLTGSATVSATGGTGTLTYTWDSNAGSQDGTTATGLGVGPYTVTVVDEEGCMDITTVTINEPASAITGSVDNIISSACGIATGGIDISASGGTPPYTYAWSNLTNNEDLSSAGAGAYEVTVTDDNDCFIVLNGSIPNADGPSVDAIVVTNAACEGDSNGSLDLQFSGGTMPYVIDWDNAPDVEDPSGLPAGVYNVLITDDNGCVVTGTATITEPEVLMASVNTTQSNCNDATGSLQLTVTGGSAIASYDWDNAPDVEDPDNLAAGTYNVIVTDVNGCVANATGIITEPDAPVGTSGQTDALCNAADNGSVFVNITSGGGGYSYDWGDPTLDGNASNGGLAPGDYTIVVTDVNNCSVTFMESVDEPAVITAVIDPTSTLCFGQANGSATVMPSGGSGTGYTYSWCSGESTATATALNSGPCQVEVTDDTGCSEIFNTTIPEAVVLEASLVSATGLNCNQDGSGSIDITVSGGDGNWDYDWTGGLGNIQDPGSLDAGFYSVQITDGNNCETQLINIEVTEPDALDITWSASDASCNLPNGSIDVDVTGGTGNIDYTWSPSLPNQPDHTNSVTSGTYTLDIIDENGCPLSETIIVNEPNALEVIEELGSTLDCFGDADGTVSIEINGGSGPGTYQYDWGSGLPDSPDLSGLTVGTYNVQITDDNGCIISAMAEVVEPTPLQITLDSSTDPSCQTPDGIISISVAGGTVAGDYSYNWNNGTYNTSSISGLGSGTYNIEVSDDNGCLLQDNFSIQAPDSFTPSESNIDVSCNGLNDGEIMISIVDGSGTFIYDWSDTTIPDTPNPTDLSPGSYDVQITDGVTGCINTIFAIEISEPDAIDLNSSSIVDATCLNNNGQIDATISGGTGNLTYSWSGPNSFSANTEDINGLESGDYTLFVMDENLCPASLLVTVDIPDAPTLSATPTDVLCNGGSTGTILATPSNPNGAVTYTWSQIGIGDTDIATGLSIGTYNVMITDALDCTAEVLNIVIDQPQVIDVQFSSTDSDCDIDNGTIDLVASGGVGNFTFDWFDLPDTEDQTSVGPGNYSVTVYDGNNCPAETIATVNQPNPAAVTAVPTDVNCYQASTGSINLDVVGNNGPYNFQWSGTTQTVEDPTNLPAGTYAVTVSDNDGCETYENLIIINEGSEIQVSGTISPALCNQNNGAIQLTVNGGTGPYTFDWADPTVPDIQNPIGLASGNYAVTVYDNLLCPSTNSFSVTDPAGVQFDQDQTNNLCFGNTDGIASVNIISGVAPFTIQWDDPTIPDGASASSLAAGQYTGVIIDGNNCTQPFSFDIDQPASALDAQSQSSQSVSCFGFSDGTALVQPTGGTGPYTYLWSNNETTQEIFGLVANTSYSATITDANLCTFEVPAIVLTQPDELIVNNSFTDLDCNGDNSGTINLIATGGNGSYSFDWDNNQYDGLSQLSGLSGGTYNVNVYDVEGCDEQLSFTLDEPAAIDLSVAAVSQYDSYNISCNGYTDGFINLNIAGGAGGYSFNWSNGASTQDLTDISAGDYAVTVTDANLCSQEILTQLLEPTAIDIDFEAIDVRCAGQTNGAVVVTNAQGGAGPYVYGLDESPFGIGVFNGLPAGDYQLVTQDANGCETTSSLNITEPDSVLVDLGEDIEILFGDSTLISPEIQLGGAPLSILEWGNQDVLCPQGNCLTLNVQPQNTTTYRITVVDENGCQHEDDIVVRVRKDRNVYAPNVFNPNSDNPENSVFQLFTGRGVTMIEEFIVVDRWGEILYRIPEAFDPNTSTVLWGWDGTLKDQPMNPGVYVYYAKVRFLDDEVIEYAGDVTLLK